MQIGGWGGLGGDSDPLGCEFGGLEWRGGGGGGGGESEESSGSHSAVR